MVKVILEDDPVIGNVLPADVAHPEMKHGY